MECTIPLDNIYPRYTFRKIRRINGFRFSRKDPPINLNPFSPFTTYIRPYRRHIVFGLICLLIAQIIATSIPLVLKQGIETVENGMDAIGAGGAGDIPIQLLDEITYYGVIIAVFGLLQWGASVGMRWCLMGMGRLMERDIRSLYMRHLLKLPLSFFQQSRAGDLMARATSDIEFVARFPGETFRVTLTVVATFCLSLALMCAIDWQLAILSLAPIPFTIFLLRFVSEKVRDGYRHIQEYFAEMMACIQENLSGIRVVKTFTLEEDQAEKFIHFNEAFVSGNRKMAQIHSLLFPFTSLLTGISMILILWLGGLKVIDGAMTLGAFVAFNALLIRLGVPLLQVGSMVNQYQLAVASITRINEVLRKPVQKEETGTANTPKVKGEIAFHNLHFSYNGRPVLQDINIHVPAGSTLALVGRVGTGKTTLGRLIPRLIHANGGRVCIDGIPIESLPFSAIRQAIGYVPQDTFLFSETIRENIVLGHEDATDSEVKEAAEIAQLSVDLEDMSAGMETIVGERGVTLSGGQKQRTALARAIIRRPQILILDDALAAVDARTESEILKRLRHVMAARTTILIAHRISTVRAADHIVVLDDGRIAEQGDHEALMALNGIYADMYHRQHLADEIEGM